MKKILVIEDDSIMRENTQEILELARYQVFTATNGRAGSILARELLPDLIVCDIMMPELDGYGVLHLLSKDPATAAIPFIFITAKAEKSEVRKGMDLGADDYLTKPFEDTELLSAISSRLRRSDVLRKEFSRSSEGLASFLEDVKGIEELGHLSTQRQVSLYKKKEIIFHSGDRPQYVYFLNRGMVKTYKTHADGKEFITNIFKAGDFLGFIPVFEAQDYHESALVMEESEIYKIPKEDFLSLVHRNREVAGQFIKMLSNQIEHQEKHLLRLAYDSVRKRTAQILLQLAQAGPSGELTSLKVSREDLASMAGTASETLIRCLGEFKEDKLIEVRGREITVLSEKGLRLIS
jgi:CRP/FNR family transcriptional regulator, polysaccharide utilization system transcription regulator